MIFDTHAHYYDEAFDADRAALLASLPGRGWPWWSAPAATWSPSRQSIALAERYGFLYAAAGYHPENLEGAALSDLDAVKALCAHPKVVAVGEIGLDYYWLKTPEERANSRDFFDAQLSLAEELNLPAIVHDRDAHRDCLDIVRAHPGVRGCSTATPAAWRDARVLVDRGWMLSFTGNITFKNARRAPDISPLAAPGAADAGDRRPLHGPRAVPGPAVRLHHDRPLRRDGGPAPGPHSGRGGRPLPWRTARSSSASPEGRTAPGRPSVLDLN